MFRRIAALAILTGVLASCAESPTASAAPSDPGLKINGQVTGPAGVELAGMIALLTVTKPTDNGWGIYYDTVDETIVDANGKFRLDGPPLSKHICRNFKVSVSGNGFSGSYFGYPCTDEVQNISIDVAVTPPPEVTPPTLVSFALTPTSVDVSTSSATVVATMRVTDEVPGVEHVNVWIEAPSGALYVHDWVYAPISGTRFDGTWEAVLIIPSNAETGVWLINQINTSDRAGNPLHVETNVLQTRGFPTEVEVR